jgi:hypothetical protein
VPGDTESFRLFFSVLFPAFSCAFRAKAGPKSFELLPMDGDGPHLFSEGVISTLGDEAGGVFSPDGNEFYFSELNPATTGSKVGLLCVSDWREGKWTTRRSCYFPRVRGKTGNYDVFRSQRVDRQYKEAEDMGPIFNGATIDTCEAVIATCG